MSIRIRYSSNVFALFMSRLEKKRTRLFFGCSKKTLVYVEGRFTSNSIITYNYFLLSKSEIDIKKNSFNSKELKAK